MPWNILVINASRGTIKNLGTLAFNTLHKTTNELNKYMNSTPFPIRTYAQTTVIPSAGIKTTWPIRGQETDLRLQKTVDASVAFTIHGIRIHECKMRKRHATSFP